MTTINQCKRVFDQVYVTDGDTNDNAQALLTAIDANVGGSISVTDGSTTVDPAISVAFTGATVTDGGGGVAQVAVSGGLALPITLDPNDVLADDGSNPLIGADANGNPYLQAYLAGVAVGSFYFSNSGTPRASSFQVLNPPMTDLVVDTVLTDGSLPPGEYYIVICTVDANGGVGTPSNEIHATVGAGDNGDVKISGTPNGGVSYRIYYGSTSGGQDHYVDNLGYVNPWYLYDLSGAVAGSPPSENNALCMDFPAGNVSRLGVGLFTLPINLAWRDGPFPGLATSSYSYVTDANADPKVDITANDFGVELSGSKNAYGLRGATFGAVNYGSGTVDGMNLYGVGGCVAAEFSVVNDAGSGTLLQAADIRLRAIENGNAGGAAGTIVKASGAVCESLASLLKTGTTTDLSGFEVAPSTATSGATVTNMYGLLVGDLTAASNNFAIKTGLGKVEFGDSAKADGGFIFPTSDPMKVGAWWNNSGVLTISAAT